jgi:hypothetical protein
MPLGRKWPSGLSPFGPGDRSLKTHPEQILLDAWVTWAAWELVGPRPMLWPTASPLP